MADSLAILSLPPACSVLRTTNCGISSQRLVQKENGKVCGGVVRSCRRWRLAATRSMVPEDEKMTRRSPLDFRVEWDRPSVDGRSLGIAMASGLPVQDCRLSVDSNKRRSTALGICFSLQSPKKKGFGKLPSKKKTVDKRSDSVAEKVADSELGDERSLEEPEDDVVPEVVTNRMLRRIALTVGVPLAVGVVFFPLYYYLKVVKKVDVPEWLPLLTSMLTFGTAGLGITYGVLSASWDPAREGSLLGWKEAQLNFPVFLETVQGKRGKK